MIFSFFLKILIIESYLEIVDSLERLILACGKKPYVLTVGKPTPAKLANFLEIDVFVLISCSENSLLDPSEFLKPIVTPYELSLALDKNSVWDTTKYELDINKVAPQVEELVKSCEEMALERGDLDSDEEPHFSLVTGGYGINKKFVTVSYSATNDCEESAIIKRSDGHVSTFVSQSASAEYLKTRTYKGLEVKKGETAVEYAEQGRSGIAKGYTHEQ